MARELKIPAEGRWWWWCGGGRAEARGRGVVVVHCVLGAGDVLDEVNVVSVVLLLVHALAGGSLTLKLPPLRGACAHNTDHQER